MSRKVLNHNMLEEMLGKRCCMAYGYDAKHGVLIEEQIIPGITLRREQNAVVRVNHFLGLFSEIHKTIDSVNLSLTYLYWFKNADTFCMNHKQDETITNNMHRACCIREELFRK